MPDDAGQHPQTSQIPPNLRLLMIAEEVARAGQPVTAAALAEAIGLPKTTMHRLLITAEEEGFLQRDVDGRSFGPGRRLRRMAANTLSSQRVRTERLVIMQKLATEVGETCNLAAPGRYGMVYLDRVETHWPLRIQLPVGTQVPFHCTASGKMYLSSLRADKLARVLKWLKLEPHAKGSLTNASDLHAQLSTIAAQQYSTDTQEFMDGMVAIAVPIKDNTGRLLTTLSVHAPIQRRSLESLKAQLPALRDAAKQLEELI